MSTALAIASVTQVLKDLLNDGLINNDITGTLGVNVKVTSLPPDRIDTTLASEDSQLNLFMYHTTTNMGWRNEGFPSLNAKGERIGNPPLALDLHYLLSAYGSTELHPEILLGYGMQLLHETPVLTRDAIRTSLSINPSVPPAQLPQYLRMLSTSELADQIEQIKITPQALSTEEIYKLWAAFLTRYRPTSAYHVSVILIESKKSTKAALPVLQRNNYVVPFHQPIINKVQSQSAEAALIVDDQKILAGYRLVLQGIRLKNDLVTVNIDGHEITPLDADISDTTVTVTLPADLQPGIHGVQVVHPVLMGSPPLPHTGSSSDAQAFTLCPLTKNLKVTNVQASGGLRSADIGLTVVPAFGEMQHVVLLLNEFIPAPTSIPPVAYSFPLDTSTLGSPPATLQDIVFHVSNVKAATYLVRIQVDGAESPLLTDASGRYNNPLTTI
jgi:hypothetical protein